MNETTFRYGMRLAAAAANVHVGEIFHELGREEITKRAADAGVVTDEERLHAALMADIYKQGGCTEMLGYHLFEKMAASTIWSRELSSLVDAAYVGLAKWEASVKEGSVAAGLFNATQKSLTAAPGALTKMLQLATPAGVLAGTGAYLASRDVKEDSAANELKKVRIQEYRRLAQHLESELESKLQGGAPDVVNNVASKYVHTEV